MVFSPTVNLFYCRVFFIIFVSMAHPTRIFKTPDELEIVWQSYKDNLKEEALEWVKITYVGKEAQRMEDAFKLPYTMDGFEVFCYKNYGCVEQYFRNKDELYNDFVAICSHIKKEIRNNQITGGLLGVYNPSVTQRLNNLKDQQEHSGEVTTNIISLGNGTKPNEINS